MGEGDAEGAGEHAVAYCKGLRGIRLPTASPLFLLFLSDVTLDDRLLTREWVSLVAVAFVHYFGVS